MFNRVSAFFGEEIHSFIDLINCVQHWRGRALPYGKAFEQRMASCLLLALVRHCCVQHVYVVALECIPLVIIEWFGLEGNLKITKKRKTNLKSFVAQIAVVSGTEEAVNGTMPEHPGAVPASAFGLLAGKFSPFLPFSPQ